MRLSLLTLSLLHVIALPALAQDATTLDGVTVSASRTGQAIDDAPQTVVILDRQAIDQQLLLSSNSSDVLSNLLPSYTPSRGKMTGSGETLRGRTPLVLLDGIPQSNPLRPTGRELHTIDYSMVERIEVVQGANAMNGLGATGGTINLITRRAETGQTRQHFGVQTTVPTTGVDAETASYRANYFATGGSGAWDYLVGGSYETQGLWLDGEGRPIGADVTQGDLMASRAWNLSGKLGYAIDEDQQLVLSTNRYRLKSDGDYLTVNGDRDAGIPTTSRRGTPPGRPAWNDVWTSGLSYRHRDLAGMQLDALVYHQAFEGLFGATNSSSFQDTTIAPRGTLYDQSRTVDAKTGSKTTLGRDDLFGGRFKFTVGLDTLWNSGKQDLYATGRTYVPQSKYRDLAGFVQAEYRLLPTLTVQGGWRHEDGRLRIDSYRTLAAFNRVLVQGGELSYKENLLNAGLVYAPAEGFNLFASYSEGFGIPDVGRVLRSIDTEGVSVSSLRALDAVLTRNVEFGARYHQGPWDADLSLFRSRSDYGTRIILVDDAYQLAREKNRIDGLDAALKYRIDDRHRVGVSYAWTRGHYDSDGNGSLDARLDGLNIAPNRVIGTWSAQWTPAFSTFVQGQYAFARRFDDPDMNFGGYALFDVSAEYRLSRGSVQLGVANLFDRQYITYYSQSALASDDRHFAGRGRTVTLGYALDF